MANLSPEVATLSFIKLGGGTFGCGWCGRVSPIFRADLYRDHFWFQCPACAANTPPRGAEVIRGLPKWLQRSLKINFPGEPLVLAPESFLERHLESLFDHFGHDAEQNLILEPYGKQAAIEARVAVFAKRLNVGYSVTLPSWHAPYWDDCFRVTLYKPKEASL
jgi:hypothetical protein